MFALAVVAGGIVIGTFSGLRYLLRRAWALVSRSSREVGDYTGSSAKKKPGFFRRQLNQFVQTIAENETSCRLAAVYVLHTDLRAIERLGPDAEMDATDVLPQEEQLGMTREKVKWSSAFGVVSASTAKRAIVTVRAWRPVLPDERSRESGANLTQTIEQYAKQWRIEYLHLEFPSGEELVLIDDPKGTRVVPSEFTQHYEPAQPQRRARAEPQRETAEKEKGSIVIDAEVVQKK